MTSIRPDETGECPPNTKPCSNNTSMQNTICANQTELDEGLCPINDFYIAKINETTELDLQIFNILPFIDDLAFVYSKDYADSLPVVSYRLEDLDACYWFFKTQKEAHNHYIGSRESEFLQNSGCNFMYGHNSHWQKLSYYEISEREL